MNSAATLPNNEQHKAPNINTVLDGYPTLSETHFICGEPRWLKTARRALFLLSGCGLAYFATTAANIPLTLTLVLWIVSGLMILVATRPSRDLIHYASDPQGVYFPSRQKAKIMGSALPQTWLFVPWSNIASVCVQLLPTESENTKGVTFCLPVSAEERQVYFDGTAMLAYDEAQHFAYRGCILVGFPNAFKSPHETIALLRKFQYMARDSQTTTECQNLQTAH